MLEDGIAIVLRNFSLSMFIFACFFIILHSMMRKHLMKAEIVYRWIALFALGITSIDAFIFHAFFPEISAANIGWSNSPFQYEVAMANLAFGVIGILSFNASYGFRLATVIGSTCWLWGDALGHIDQIFRFSNMTTGNAGSWLWTDIIVPLILILCIRKLKLAKR